MKMLTHVLYYSMYSSSTTHVCIVDLVDLICVG